MSSDRRTPAALPLALVVCVLVVAGVARTPRAAVGKPLTVTAPQHPAAGEAALAPRSRAAIRDWQQSRGASPTRYLNGAEAELLRTAALPPPAVSENSPPSQAPPAVEPDASSVCLRALRKGDVLVVWKLDRLGRNLAHLVNTVQDLGSRGVGLRVLAAQGAQVDTTTRGRPPRVRHLRAAGRLRAGADPQTHGGGGSRPRGLAAERAAAKFALSKAQVRLALILLLERMSPRFEGTL